MTRCLVSLLYTKKPQTKPHLIKQETTKKLSYALLPQLLFFFFVLKSSEVEHKCVL